MAQFESTHLSIAVPSLHFLSLKGEKINKTKKGKASLQAMESFWHGWSLQH